MELAKTPGKRTTPQGGLVTIYLPTKFEKSVPLHDVDEIEEVNLSRQTSLPSGPFDSIWDGFCLGFSKVTLGSCQRNIYNLPSKD